MPEAAQAPADVAIRQDDDLGVTMAAIGKSDWLIAFDAASGRERWRFELGPRFLGRSGAFILSTVLNEPEGAERAVAPLEALGVNLMARLPEGRRWTYFEPHDVRYDTPDGLIASPALAERYPDAVPRVIRSGLGREAVREGGTRLPGTGEHRPQWRSRS